MTSGAAPGTRPAASSATLADLPADIPEEIPAVSAPIPAASAPIPAASAGDQPAGSAEVAAALDGATAAIVWRKDARATGGFRSQWVERSGDKAQVAGERPGLIAVSSRSLWSIGTTIVKGCPQNKQDREGQPVTRGDGSPIRERPDMEMPELVRASDGLRVAPWKDGHGYPINGVTCPPTLQASGASISFEGGIGPFVVADQRGYEDHGGAHGVRSAQSFAINLEKGLAAPLAPPASDLPGLLRSARKSEGGAPDGGSLAAVIPLYGPLGEAIALYRFVFPDSYAGGTGGNSYSNDVLVTSRHLPAELAPYRRLPAWAVPALDGGKAQHLFLIPPALAAEARRQFDAAYPVPARAPARR